MSNAPHDPHDPVWGARPGRLRVIAADTPFLLRRARLPDPATIPPRQWLLGTALLRGFVTILVAPGGTGKSLLAMAACASVATGREIIGEHVFERVNAGYVNLEDPMDELDRRLAALIMHHKLDADELEGRLWMNSGDDRGLIIAALSDDGFDIVNPDVDALINAIQANEIGLLVVDPVAESHDLEENSNPQMVRASKAWRTVARATNCAILLVHHVRKGQVLDIDAARGAKALTDSARVGLLLSPMSEEDAKEIGIEKDARFQYVRLDNAKVNLSPRASKASWFQLRQVSLGNGTNDYPSGDKVAAIAPWSPPSTFGDLTVEQCNLALDGIAKGHRDGAPYSADKRSKDRWAGHVLIELFNLENGEARAVRMITTWLKSGVLFEADYYDKAQRKPRKGLSVNDAKRPGNELSA